MINHNDEIVLKAIEAIESHKDDRFRPRDKTISSFLKGAITSPFFSYYASHPDLCGAARITAQEVNCACRKLINDEKIKKIDSSGIPYYKTIEEPLFLSTCTKEEQGYIKMIGDYILTTYPNMQCIEKVYRIAYQNPNIVGKNSIVFSHMWFAKQNGQLVFRYKKSQNDSEKNTYKDNTILANEMQKQTIINVIDFLLS